MAQRSSVPTFGNWNTEENVSYTAYFEKVRKREVMAGGKIDLNGSQQNPNIFSTNKSPVRGPPSKRNVKTEAENVPNAVMIKVERSVTREDNDLERPTEFELYQQKNQGQGDLSFTKEQKSSNDFSNATKHERFEDGNLRRTTDSPSQNNLAGQRVTSYSSLHSHVGAKVGGKGIGVSSPLWESRVSSENSIHGLAPLTHTQSRLRPVNRGNESPDHSPSVPKFGDWDEADPTASDGYSQIFNKVLEERQSGVGNAAVPTETSYANLRKHPRNENSKRFCCFPWRGK